MTKRGFAKHAIFAIIFITALMPLPAVRAEGAGSSIASLVPTQMLSARKIFLSNAGLDSGSIVALNPFGKGKADMPYASFAAAMKSWGHFSFVATPADSELVFEFRVESSFSSFNGPYAAYATFLGVAIFDTKTHVVLWTVKSPIDINKQFDQNVTASATKLVDSIRALVGAASDAVK